jgi:predicted secreted protein
MSDGNSAFGTTLKWNATALAELTGISGPSMKADTIDLTNHDSADGFREFVAGVRDGGEISIEGNFLSSDTTGQMAFITDAQAGTEREVIITGPTADAFTWTMDCIVTAFEPTHPYDGKLGFTATLKVTGKPVLAVTLSTGMSALSGIEENAGGAITFLPTFAIGTFAYTTSVNTASSYIKLTPTAASHTITISNGTSDQTVTSGAQSGEIDLGAAGTITTVTVKVQESGTVAKTYTIYVTRAAP